MLQWRPQAYEVYKSPLFYQCLGGLQTEEQRPAIAAWLKQIRCDFLSLAYSPFTLNVNVSLLFCA